MHLKIRPSEAKYLEESDFDVKKFPAPKSFENYEKPNKSETNLRKSFPGAKKSEIANRPKCVLPKFCADRSHVRKVCRREPTIERTNERTNERMLRNFKSLVDLIDF